MMEDHKDQYQALKREWRLNIHRFKALYSRRPVKQSQLDILINYILLLYGQILQNPFYIEHQARLNLKRKSVEEMRDSLMGYMDFKDISKITDNIPKIVQREINLKYEDITYDILEKQIVKAEILYKKDPKKTSYVIQDGKIVGSDGSVHRIIL